MIHPELSDPILNEIENRNVEYRSTEKGDDDEDSDESDTDSEDESEEDESEEDEDDWSEDDSIDGESSEQSSEMKITGKKDEDPELREAKKTKQTIARKLLRAVPVENMKSWQDIVTDAKRDNLQDYADKRKDLLDYGERRPFHSVYKQLAEQSSIEMEDEIRCLLNPKESRWHFEAIEHDFSKKDNKKTHAHNRVKSFEETNKLLCDAIRTYYQNVQKAKEKKPRN